ncbi:MAG TPA: hypothetical protein PKX01_14155 [Rhodocyclaceae bacterium]|nr:hypothetical protein [Rhodocyclaceae bacterium]HNE16547.1 hypothetical protein [Rhodocyclaceae bacterium]
MKTHRLSAASASAILTACLAATAHAGPIAIYDGPAIDKTSDACASFGDAISCSLPYLNFLDGLAQGTTTSAGGYVLQSSQGLLKDSIVIQAGGNAALDNSDTSPAPAVVENGFKSNSGSQHYLATGKTDGTTMSAGNMSDPTNNGLTASQDKIGTWDVSAVWLRDALTTADGKRHELMIAFDYNQPQASATSMDIWSLITVRKSDGGLPDIEFEFNGDTSGYASFSSTKNFYSQPSAADFDTVSGTICLYDNNQALPYPGGSCPKTYLGGSLVTEIDNSQGTDRTEFLAFLPELNSNLENYIKQGYDTISVRLLMGCFGGTDPDNGQGYLSAGQTTNCDTGGFGDVYIMGGAAMNRIPEPSSLSLAVLALAGWMGRALPLRRT